MEIKLQLLHKAKFSPFNSFSILFLIYQFVISLVPKRNLCWFVKTYPGTKKKKKVKKSGHMGSLSLKSHTNILFKTRKKEGPGREGWETQAGQQEGRTFKSLKWPKEFAQSLHFISAPPSTLEISQPALRSGCLSFVLTSPFHWPMTDTDSSYKTRPAKV